MSEANRIGLLIANPVFCLFVPLSFGSLHHHNLESDDNFSHELDALQKGGPNMLQRQGLNAKKMLRRQSSLGVGQGMGSIGRAGPPRTPKGGGSRRNLLLEGTED